MVPIAITVNGKLRKAQVEPRLLLVHFLREQVHLTGTHVGCDTSQCGACTVLIDGRSAKSCTLFAVQADGAEVLTIEGLGTDDKLHPLQEGFWEEHGLQCGYCTPGMLMAAKALLDRNPSPSRQDVVEASGAGELEGRQGRRALGPTHQRAHVDPVADGDAQRFAAHAPSGFRGTVLQPESEHAGTPFQHFRVQHAGE